MASQISRVCGPTPLTALTILMVTFLRDAGSDPAEYISYLGEPVDQIFQSYTIENTTSANVFYSFNNDTDPDTWAQSVLRIKPGQTHSDRLLIKRIKLYTTVTEAVQIVVHSD